MINRLTNIQIVEWMVIILLSLVIGCTEDPNKENKLKFSREVQNIVGDYIDQVEYDSLSSYKPDISYAKIADNLVKVSLTYHLSDTVQQDDWQINIRPKFDPTFHWAPHLTPTDEHIISQHSFRAPALIAASEERQLVVMPDLDALGEGSPVKWYMDMNASDNRLTLGMSNYRIEEHVLFKRKSGAIYPPGKFDVSFYLMTTDIRSDIFNPWRKPLKFFWENWGKPALEQGQPIDGSLEPYVRHTYNWAFDSWEESVWQEFNLSGKQVGAPAFIVNVTQSPNYPGMVDEREFRSIWNQAWFSSLRSAQGLFRYARRTNNNELMTKAKMTKELALSFPQEEGFFPSLIATEMEDVEADGETYNRSKGWSTYYFGNSNRNPYTGDPKEAPYHVLDMSWTAYLMLTWYDELEEDERLLTYAGRYADALVELQGKEGFFPGWLSKESLEPLNHLNKSPETSMSVTFLLKLYKLTGNKKYFSSAQKAMEAVIENIIPVGRWEDFETYWSCSRYGEKDLVNKKVKRNDMYKQNNFSMYWTAEALLESYLATEDKKYLKYGRRTLDELLMTQATWQPPYIHVNALGGFGVMNADGEWNDARQSLFSELIVRYGKILDNQEYIQRGVAALRASFVMMYAPENPRTKEQWEQKWPFFGEEDYGFMMENYGHGGLTSSEGIGIGSFTIYDWGNGAASEAYNRILDHYGKDLINSGTY